MKKLLLLVIVLLVSFSNMAFALPSQSQTSNAVVSPNGMPETISLLDTTPLYPTPDDTLKSWASLSPQDVKVVQTQDDGTGYVQSDGRRWIQIHTMWLGDMWIRVENHKLGVIRPLSADHNLAADTPLYDSPYHEAANGAVLSPQTVHAKAEFLSPSGFYAIQIETSWKGDQWLINPEIDN